MPKQGRWYFDKPGYRSEGEWAWDEDRLYSKISKTPDENGCLNWQGAMSPSGALLGVYRNGRQQMSQARRIVWMSKNNKYVTPYSVSLTCGNQRCCNIEHFVLKKNNRTDTYE